MNTLTLTQREINVALSVLLENRQLTVQNAELEKEKAELEKQNSQLRYLNVAATREASRQAEHAEYWKQEAERWRRIAAHPDEMDNFPTPPEVITALRTLRQNPHFRLISGIQ